MFSLFFLARLERFERPTFSLGVRYSIQLSYNRTIVILTKNNINEGWSYGTILLIFLWKEKPPHFPNFTKLLVSLVQVLRVRTL